MSGAASTMQVGVGLASDEAFQGLLGQYGNKITVKEAARSGPCSCCSCCYMCFGGCWNTDEEFTVVQRADDGTADDKEVFHIQEHSTCCCRCLCGGSRPWTMSLSTLPLKEEILMFERPLRCPLSFCKCCCGQEVEVYSQPSHTYVGSVQESCWICIPTFKVVDRARQPVYTLFTTGTCCCGTCVNCCQDCSCSRCMVSAYECRMIECTMAILRTLCICCWCCFPQRVPFQIKAVSGSAEGTINRLPRVVMEDKAFEDDADTFDLVAPEGASPDDMARLLAATLILNELFYEGDAASKGDRGAND